MWQPSVMACTWPLCIDCLHPQEDCECRCKTCWHALEDCWCLGHQARPPVSSLPRDEAAVNAAFTMPPCTLETSFAMAEFQAEVHAESQAKSRVESTTTEFQAELPAAEAQAGFQAKTKRKNSGIQALQRMFGGIAKTFEQCIQHSPGIQALQSMFGGTINPAPYSTGSRKELPRPSAILQALQRHERINS